MYNRTASTFEINPELLKSQENLVNKLFTRLKATFADGKSAKIVEARKCCQRAANELKSGRGTTSFRYVVECLQTAYNLFSEADSDIKWTCLSELNDAKQIYFSLVNDEAYKHEVFGDECANSGNYPTAKYSYEQAIYKYKFTENFKKIEEVNKKLDFAAAENLLCHAKNFKQNGEYRKAIDNTINAKKLFISSGHKEKLFQCEELNTELTTIFSKLCANNNQTATNYEISANEKMKVKQYNEAISLYTSAQSKYNVSENFEAGKRCQQKIDACNEILKAIANYNNGVKLKNQNDLIKAGYDLYKAKFVFEKYDLEEELSNCMIHINVCDSERYRIENQADSCFKQAKLDYYENNIASALQEFENARKLYYNIDNTIAASKCNPFIENCKKIYHQINSIFNNGLQCMKNEEFTKAITLFQQAMQNYEQCDISKFVNYCRQNIEQCNQKLNALKQNGYDQCNLGVSTYNKGQFEDAITHFEQSYTTYKNANMHEQAEYCMSMITKCKQYIEIQKLIDDGWRDYINDYYQNAIDNFKTAKTKCEKCWKERVDECDEAVNKCFYAIGVKYYNSGIHNNDYSESISDLETARDYFNTAGYSNDARDCDSAIRNIIERQKEEDYKQANSDFCDGNYYANRGDWFHAKQYYESALQNGYDRDECEQAIKECEDELLEQYYK